MIEDSYGFSAFGSVRFAHLVCMSLFLLLPLFQFFSLSLSARSSPHLMRFVLFIPLVKKKTCNAFSSAARFFPHVFLCSATRCPLQVASVRTLFFFSRFFPIVFLCSTLFFHTTSLKYMSSSASDSPAVRHVRSWVASVISGVTVVLLLQTVKIANVLKTVSAHYLFAPPLAVALQ